MMENNKKDRLYKQVSTSEDTLDGCIEKTSNDEEEEQEDDELGPGMVPTSRHQRRFRFLRYTMMLLAVGLVAALAFTIGVCTSPRRSSLAHASSSTSTTNLNLDTMQDCGDSVEEARGKGCIYDVMLQLWVPRACYDGEFSETYLAKYKWKWYYDIDAKREMPDEVMRRGEHGVAFMVDDYHRRHCTYTWEVTTRALQAGKPLLEEFLSFEHVQHCDMMLFMPPWNATEHPMAVEAHSGFARCASYDSWRQRMPE